MFLNIPFSDTLNLFSAFTVRYQGSYPCLCKR
jgi:hypothetical protein